MKTSKYEIFKDKKGEFRFNLLSKNGEVVASGESYTEKRGVMNAVKKMKEWANTDVIVDNTLEAKTTKPVEGKSKAMKGAKKTK